MASLDDAPKLKGNLIYLWKLSKETINEVGVLMNSNRFKVIYKLMKSQLILLKLRDTSDDQRIIIANIYPIYTKRLTNKTI